MPNSHINIATGSIKIKKKNKKFKCAEGDINNDNITDKVSENNITCLNLTRENLKTSRVIKGNIII